MDIAQSRECIKDIMLYQIQVHTKRMGRGVAPHAENAFEHQCESSMLGLLRFGGVCIDSYLRGSTIRCAEAMVYQFRPIEATTCCLPKSPECALGCFVYSVKQVLLKHFSLATAHDLRVDVAVLHFAYDICDSSLCLSERCCPINVDYRSVFIHLVSYER